MTRIRLVPIVLIAVLVLAVLFGSWQAYQHFNLLGPLKRNIQQVEGVKTVSISTGSPDEVVVQLGPFNKLKNGDLQQTYHAIAKQISAKLGSSVNLDIADHHDAQLEQVLEGFRPMLMEGIAKSNYTEMIAQLSQQAKKQGIQASFTMDEKYIYIQLAKGSHYLYDVMPLHQGGAAS